MLRTENKKKNEQHNSLGVIMQDDIFKVLKET